MQNQSSTTPDSSVKINLNSAINSLVDTKLALELIINNIHDTKTVSFIACSHLDNIENLLAELDN